VHQLTVGITLQLLAPYTFLYEHNFIAGDMVFNIFSSASLTFQGDKLSKSVQVSKKEVVFTPVSICEVSGFYFLLSNVV
jgi:small basic protein